MENKVKILVADDDVSILHTLAAALRSLNYEVSVVSDGEHVVAMIKETLPNIILLDVSMPNMEGLEVLKQLKANEATKTIPVIMMTAQTETEERVAALKAGADDFLMKPIDEVELQTRVSSQFKVKAYYENSRDFQQILEKEVTSRTRELNKAFEKIKVASLDTVYRLARAAEYKDEDTGAHVQRMSHYTSAIARQMKLDDKFVENILWAAPMHDIGKIGIADRILLKPGKLDEEEFAIMKRHTTIGADILKDADADFMRLAGEIALTHHEKWNGSGYPRALKGSDIPLGGRIVALADVFDALTSERPYKAAFPLEKAFAIIVEGKGIHFDPEVTEAFFAIENEIIAELNWWKFMSSTPTTGETDLSNLFK